MSNTLNNIWMVTATGKQWFLFNPDPNNVCLEDIAVGLSRAARWAGQTNPHLKAYSVAQHSLMVARHVPEDARLTALLHDAHEAYLGDLITPLKRALAIKSPDARRAFDEIEELTAKAVHRAFDIDWPLPHETVKLIKAADNGAAATEKIDLIPPVDFEFDNGADPLIDCALPILSEHDARDRFIDAVKDAVAARVGV